MGVNGVIPAGTKFYLIAELDPTKPADIKSGTGRDKVFEQDYVTTVTLTIVFSFPEKHVWQMFPFRASYCGLPFKTRTRAHPPHCSYTTFCGNISAARRILISFGSTFPRYFSIIGIKMCSMP